MSYTPIVKSSIGNNEYFIHSNTNSATGKANVLAFLGCFAPYISSVSQRLNGMPRNFILGLWALESGWGTAGDRTRRQNWANISYTDPDHPADNIGSDGNFAKFPGINASCNGFVSFFNDRADPDGANSQTYQRMLDYCASTSSPSYSVLTDYLIEAGYNEDDPFKGNLLDCCDLVDEYINQV